MGRGLGPLRDVAFRRLLAGQLASGVGDAFYAVALPWYVLSAHGGGLLLGTVLAVYGTSRTVMLAVAGRAADRFRPWTVMIGADLVRGLALVAFALAAGGGRPSLALLASIAVVLGIGSGFFLPASTTIIPTLLDDDELQAGNALSGANAQVSSLLGPLLGGPVVALLGSSTAFSVDAVTFGVSVVSLIGVRRAMRARAVARAAERADVADVADTRTPARLSVLVRERPVLVTVFLMLVVANLVLGGVGAVGLPALAHGPLRSGATGYGVLIAVWALGALGGTLAAARRDRLRRPSVVASTAYLAGAAMIVLVPYLGGMAGAVLALCAAGFTLGFGNVITDTALMRWAPRALLGRVIALIQLGSYGIYPLSTLLAGIVVHGLGAAILFPFSGAAIAVAMLGALTRRSWREFGAPDIASGRAGATAAGAS